MHPRATKFFTSFSFNNFKTNYERSGWLGTPRPREIHLSTNSYTNNFAYEPSMDRPIEFRATTERDFSLDPDFPYDVRAKMNTELNSNEILTRVPKPFSSLALLSSSLICSVSERKREGKETMGAHRDVQLKNGKSCAAKYLSLSPRPFLRQSLSPPVSRVLSFSIPSPPLATWRRNSKLYFN